MEKLNQHETLIIADRLFTHFGYDGKRHAKKYLRTRSLRFFNFTISRRTFPNLWFAQRKEARFIKELYGGFLTFNHDSGNKYVHALKDVIIPTIIKFLKKNKMNQIFAIADWKKKEPYNFVLKLNEDEIKLVIGTYKKEVYFFDHDFTWIFVITQENFSFLASSKNIIEKFKKNFKKYKDYDTEREMLLP